MRRWGVKTRGVYCAAIALVCACGDTTPPLQTAEPGVVFTYPINGEVDVPSGARIVVTFSDNVVAGALGSCTATSGAFCVVGPDGPVAATPEVTGDGRSVQLEGGFEPGTKNDVFVRSELMPDATNLPTGTPLFSFTTRSERPRAAAPTVVAINGSDPAAIDSFRPMFETTTLRLVFSEPLDPRTVRLAAGSIELLDGGGSLVPASVFSEGVHVSIDPKDDLTAGASYTLRLGSTLADLGGQAMAPATFTITPKQTRNGEPVIHTLKIRKPTDPGPKLSRSGATPNEVVVAKPLIGRETSTMLDGGLNAELHDPKALGGPIAFTLRKGQRLSMTGMNIKLGGEIPSGLDTGDVTIELLTDAGGRLYRNPYQAQEQRPENARAPLYVDLTMDLAIYAKDPTGNAALTQTILGVQSTGTAIATDSILAIETVGAMDLKLLGVTQAPTNMVLELSTDGTHADPPADTTPPQLVASLPGQSGEAAVDSGIELIFDEPIDIERARAGGIKLEDTVSGAVPATIESHGAAVVVRPLQPLAYSRIYRVVMSDVADLAGNKPTIPNLSFTSPALQGSDVPTTVVAIHPGAPCALTGANGTTSGHCVGGQGSDEAYQLFTLAANDPIEVAFSSPVRRSSVTRGAACNQGSVRIEEVDASGTCTAVVAGTLMTRDRSLTFVPDVPWVDGKKYRFQLVSGTNTGCDTGDICGPQNAMNFDPLNGTENGDAGGAPLAITFTGAPASKGTYMFAKAAPFTDVNGSGFIESAEQRRDENRAGLKITGTTGAVESASFNGPDCDPTTPEKEACMYMTGAMPSEMGELTENCTLPGGGTADKCVPVTMGPQAMLATSIQMHAVASVIFDIPIDTDTGTSVMRIREPADGVKGYIIDKGGIPTMVAALDLYMDAPDMSILLSSHDLHSKKLSVQLEGPVTFLADGRIAIDLTNTAELPVVVGISGAATGTVKMVVPQGQMKLQLLSPALRGAAL